MMNANLEAVVNTLNINELYALRRTLDAISQDFYNQDEESEASESIDNIIDELDDYIAYREDEMEKTAEYEERQRAGIDYPIF